MAGAAESLLFGAAAWLLTWLIHSTVLLGAAALLSRVAGDRIERAREALWRTALFGPIVTATAQLVVPVAPARRLFMNAASQGFYFRAGLVQSAGPATPDPWMAPALTALLWATVICIAIGITRWGRLLSARHRWVASLGPRAPRLGLSQRASRLAGGRAVQVTIAPHAVTPAALGLREICLPPRALAELSRHELDAVLLHEIAHLRGHDSLWLGAAAVVERVLWLQPLQRMAVARIRAAAEARCDAWALERRAEPIALAGALARVSEWMMGVKPVTAAAAVHAADSLALARVRRILDPDAGAVRPLSRRLAALLSSGMIVGSLVLLPGFSPVNRGWPLAASALAYTISAVDDAGPFTLTMRAGRVEAMTMDDRPLDRSHFRQVADRILVSDDAGRVVLELHLIPKGGITWDSRPRSTPTGS